MWKFAIGTSMFALGQAEAVTKIFPYADLVLNGGALAVLAWAVWHAYTRTIPSQQKMFTKTLDDMADRHERWETKRDENSETRHERWEANRHRDSEKLSAALRQLSMTCAKTQTLGIQQAEQQ